MLTIVGGVESIKRELEAIEFDLFPKTSYAEIITVILSSIIGRVKL